MPATEEPSETASAETQPVSAELLKRYKDGATGDATTVTQNHVSRLVNLLDEGEVASLSPLVKKAVNEFFPEGVLSDARPAVSIAFYIASREVLLSATVAYDAEHPEQAHDLLLCASFAGLTFLEANPGCRGSYLSYDIKQGHIPDTPEISDKEPGSSV
jgi:hypothetical protein